MAAIVDGVFSDAVMDLVHQCVGRHLGPSVVSGARRHATSTPVGANVVVVANDVIEHVLELVERVGGTLVEELLQGLVPALDHAAGRGGGFKG